MDIKKVVINGVSYIGILKESSKNKKMILENAMQCTGSIDKRVVSKYIAQRNIGELVPITFGGRGVAYSIADLTVEENMFFKMAEVVMEVAKNKALQSVENELFDSLLGK